MARVLRPVVRGPDDGGRARGMFAYGMAAYVAGALRRICVLGCLLLGMAWPAAALPATAVTTQATALPAAPLRDYLVDRWTTRHGLPHNSIRDIAQTPDGFLWFATWEGLVRYDGLEFTVFDRSTSQPALPDNGAVSYTHLTLPTTPYV